MIFKAIDPLSTDLRDFNISYNDIINYKINKITDLIKFARNKFLIKDNSILTESGLLGVGCLCLINDTDISILGEEEAFIKYGDKIFIIASIHGG